MRQTKRGNKNSKFTRRKDEIFGEKHPHSQRRFSRLKMKIRKKKGKQKKQFDPNMVFVLTLKSESFEGYLPVKTRKNEDFNSV